MHNEQIIEQNIEQTNTETVPVKPEPEKVMTPREPSRSLLVQLQRESTFKFIIDSLRKHDYHVNNTAEYLGISRVRIYQYLRDFGITLKSLKKSFEEPVVEYDETPLIRAEMILAPKPYQFKSYEHFKDVLAALALQNIIRESQNTAAVQLILNENAIRVAEIIMYFRNSDDELVKAAWEKIDVRE